MALLSFIRAAVAHWIITPQRKATWPRLVLQALECRTVPSVGGGFTSGGIQGEYFANTDLSGTPSFTRRDVRIDFDWQNQAPGGSTSPDFAQVKADDFSVRWTGQFVPRFYEAYTFHTTADGGVRLWIRPTMSVAWIPLIDHWNGAADDKASFALRAGQTYDLRMEFTDAVGPSTARLRWSSKSTPEEAIEPAVNLGVNAVTYDYNVYADAAKMGRPEWGNVVDYFGLPLAHTDADGWPTTDAGHVFWEGQDLNKTAGTYRLQFTGQAQVTSWFGRGIFSVDGVDYRWTLPSGVGYDPATNTTTALVVVSGADLYGMNFNDTQRTADSELNTGITGVKFLRPLWPGSTGTYASAELFDTSVKQAFSRFTTLRYLTANFNEEQNWSERKLPGQLKAAWGDRHAVWENEVMLANETGKDLYITIPIDASADYVTNLANLMKYGSDGVNPYTERVDDPIYPGLNSNLRLYVEWGNENWNWAFSQANIGANASRDAVLNHTADGQIINYDGLRGWGDFRRWTGLKTVQTSDTFRSIWGDAAMGKQVRIVLEYQYDNIQDTAVEALRFVDNYFHNGDGYTHVANPKPVNYYIWGAGGASYFGASNPLGLVKNITVPDASFERATVGNGQAIVDPASSLWAFKGDAGVYRNLPRLKANTAITVVGVGSVPTTGDGSRAMYVSGDGTAEITIKFPRAGVYALDFNAAGELGTNMSNPLDFFFDNQRVTPHAQDLTPNPRPWVPGTGLGRDPAKFTNYGTVPVVVSGPGVHTFRIVGCGTPDQTTLIDNVRVASTDAIFASQLPGGGQAAGQISRMNYQTQLAAQAKYARAYGLKVVAYEGGWSLGGDTESVPLQSYAKYHDARSAGVMAKALDTFSKTGGELNVLGTYDQWYLDDAENADSYPLVQGIDAQIGRLPSTPLTAQTPVKPTTPTAAPIPLPTPPGGWFVPSVGPPDLPGTVAFDGTQWVIADVNPGGSTSAKSAPAANADPVKTATASSGLDSLTTRFSNFDPMFEAVLADPIASLELDALTKTTLAEPRTI